MTWTSREWVLACSSCKQKMSLGQDAVRNLMDYQGKVILPGYNALKDMIHLSDELGIGFLGIRAIRENVLTT